MCFAWISEQTAIISLYSFNLPVFKTEAESVYCAVRNGSLNQTDTGSYLKGYTSVKLYFHLLVFLLVKQRDQQLCAAYIYRAEVQVRSFK